MNSPIGFYLVMTDPVAGYEACAQAAVHCGLLFVQLRMKNAPPETLRQTALRVRAITRNTATRFIVNDDVELARAVDADGVHLGQEDLPLDEARRLWNVPGKLFGLSTHSEEQAAAAVALRPDYIGVGPVYATPTKARPDPVLGPERAGRIIRATPLPCVAIGGINATNLPEVLRAGAVNFCAVRAVMQSPDPEEAIRELLEIARTAQKKSFHSSE
jgi:thiamine-phosphate pyrophosphorylase